MNNYAFFAPSRLLKKTWIGDKCAQYALPTPLKNNFPVTPFARFTMLCIIWEEDSWCGAIRFLSPHSLTSPSLPLDAFLLSFYIIIFAHHRGMHLITKLMSRNHRETNNNIAWSFGIARRKYSQEMLTRILCWNCVKKLKNDLIPHWILRGTRSRTEVSSFCPIKSA